MIEMTSLGDFNRRYMQAPLRDPTAEITVYGYPITVDQFIDQRADRTYRVAAWMDERDVRKTRPLVEERFGGDVFREIAYESARHADMNALPRGAGITDCFMLDWAMKNMRTIEEAADRRKGNPFSYTDLGEHDATAKIPTRTFVGEDGQTYHELDVRGEDTDPVLLEATMNRDEILAQQELERQAERERQDRLKAEQADRERLIELQKQREQAEFEALPGYGSF